jgi:tetratricopeptide (TPR) repeat protein
MIWARRIAAVAIALATLAAIYLFCYRPLRCQYVKMVVIRPTEVAYQQSFRPGAAALAQRNLWRLTACDCAGSRDVSYHMLNAANYLAMQDHRRAANAYEAALRLDRRPELYLGLGNALAKLNERERATKYLLDAVIFNPYTLLSIEDGELRHRVQELALARQPELGPFFESANQPQFAPPE